MMRALVLVLAVLAGAKIWTQERLYREGAEEALLLAYRERAMAACQSQQPPASRGRRACRCGRGRPPSRSPSAAKASK